MRIGILGASGVLGRALVPRLRREGLTVRALVRDPSRAPVADEIAVVDLLRPETLPAALAGLDVVVNLATSIPNGAGRGDWAENDRIRVHGTRHLVATMAALERPCRLVQQSVAMLHRGDLLSDESGELVGEGVLTSAVPMEASVQGSSLDWVIVRGAALYGPGTARDHAFFERIARGALRRPAEASRWITFVHIDDLAAAFALAITLPGRRAYIAADENPLTYATLFDAVQRNPRNVNESAPAIAALPSFRVRSDRLRAAGWQLAHPDVLVCAADAVARAGSVDEVEAQ